MNPTLKKWMWRLIIASVLVLVIWIIWTSLARNWNAAKAGKNSYIPVAWTVSSPSRTTTSQGSANLHWHFQSKIVEGHSDSPYDHPGMIAPQDAGEVKYDPGFTIRFEVYGYDRGARFTYKYLWNMAELAEQNHGFFVKTVGYDKDNGIFGALREEGPNSYLMDSIDQKGNKYVLHLWATTN